MASCIDADIQLAQLNVSPQPIGDIATAAYTLPAGFFRGSLTLLDIQGRVIKRWPVDQPKGVLELPTYDLSNGVYALSLRVANKPIVVQKIVVQHF